jgi:hypothetical protein
VVLVAGAAACRGRRTGNPVRIRNGPAAVIERQRVLPLLLPLLVPRFAVWTDEKA